jgi:hypothetical protein
VKLLKALAGAYGRHRSGDVSDALLRGSQPVPSATGLAIETYNLSVYMQVGLVTIGPALDLTLDDDGVTFLDVHGHRIKLTDEDA